MIEGPIRVDESNHLRAPLYKHALIHGRPERKCRREVPRPSAPRRALLAALRALRERPEATGPRCVGLARRAFGAAPGRSGNFPGGSTSRMVGCTLKSATVYYRALSAIPLRFLKPTASSGSYPPCEAAELAQALFELQLRWLREHPDRALGNSELCPPLLDAVSCSGRARERSAAGRAARVPRFQ